MTRKKNCFIIDNDPAIASYNEYIINENGLNLRLIYKTEKEDGYFDGVSRSQKVREEKKSFGWGMAALKKEGYTKIAKSSQQACKLLFSCGGLLIS